MRGIHRYAINHCYKLINGSLITIPNIIPQGWKSATKFEVTREIRKKAVKDAFQEWLDWETETKKFYESQFRTLTDNAKIADANKVNELIDDVDKELKYVSREILEFESVDWSNEYIAYQQDSLHKEYSEKMKDEIKVEMC